MFVLQNQVVVLENCLEKSSSFQKIEGRGLDQFTFYHMLASTNHINDQQHSRRVLPADQVGK